MYKLIIFILVSVIFLSNISVDTKPANQVVFMLKDENMVLKKIKEYNAQGYYVVSMTSQGIAYYRLCDLSDCSNRNGYERGVIIVAMNKYN
jgi:hypothetical protein